MECSEPGGALRVGPLPQHCAPGPTRALRGTCRVTGREKVVTGFMLMPRGNIIQSSYRKSGSRETEVDPLSLQNLHRARTKAREPWSGVRHSAGWDLGQVAQPPLSLSFVN